MVSESLLMGRRPPSGRGRMGQAEASTPLRPFQIKDFRGGTETEAPPRAHSRSPHTARAEVNSALAACELLASGLALAGRGGRGCELGDRVPREESHLAQGPSPETRQRFLDLRPLVPPVAGPVQHDVL